MKSPVSFLKKWPSLQEFSRETIFIYDKNVLKNKDFQKWISKCSYKIAVNAGESLKTIDSYEKIAGQVQAMVAHNSLSSAGLTFVAIGGGSVGDFVGFLASTFQRGKSFRIIPTTWLAAIDSAHGGKNGLNLNHVKNQIGTFYSAEKVYIIQSVLKKLNPQQLNDSYAEAVKMSFILGGSLYNSLQKKSEVVWKALPKLIRAKYLVVQEDPFEKKGLRKILNLGHTMGHVFEAYHKLPHGQAVGLGILFALRFGLKRGSVHWDDFVIMNDKFFQIDYNITYQKAIRVPTAIVKKTLLQDKKLVGEGTIDFIFVTKPGWILKEKITVSDLIAEVKRQQKEL